MKKETPLASQKVYQWNIWLRPKFFFLKVSSTFIIPRLCYIVKVLSRKGKKSFSLKPSLLTIFSFPSFAPYTIPGTLFSKKNKVITSRAGWRKSSIFAFRLSVGKRGSTNRKLIFSRFFLFPGILFIQNVIWNNLSLLIFCKYNFGYFPLQHYWEDKALCLRPEMHLTEGLLR